jgi:pantoate kinase
MALGDVLFSARAPERRTQEEEERERRRRLLELLQQLGLQRQQQALPGGFGQGIGGGTSLLQALRLLGMMG